MSASRLRAIFLSAIVCLATPASAAAIILSGDSNAAFIGITGMILQTDDEKFIELARDLPGGPPVLVLLNSEGGYSGPAMNIGSHVRSRGYKTVIINGAICNSACPLIWLAGTARYLGRLARLGFPGASSAADDFTHAVLAMYMKSMGAPQQLIDLQRLADPCCMNSIGYDQAKEWGVLSEIKPRSSPARSSLALNGSPNSF
jgi:hypothetical protein